MNPDDQDPAFHRPCIFDPFAAFLNNPDHEFWGPEAAAVALVCPLAIFAGWYTEQPPSVQHTIASVVDRFMQHDPFYCRRRSFGIRHRKMRCVSRFKSWLRKKSKNLEHTLARLTVLRAVMNLDVYRNRSTRDDWATFSDESVDHLIAARCAGDTGIEQSCRRGLDSLPTLAREWILSAQSWRQLCNSSLSDEALACWYEIATWQRD